MIEIGFEKSDLSGNGLRSSGTPPVSRNAPVFEGKQSLSVFIDKQKSSTLYRSEFVFDPKKYPKQFVFLEYDKEYWVGFAIYLNDDYQMPKHSDILFQIHGRPDLHLGETYRNPLISLSVTGTNENRKYGVSEPHWKISTLGDSKKITPKPAKYTSFYEKGVLVPAAPDTGRWVKWVIHFKNTYKNDGFIEVWKDGVKVHKKTGIATAFNDDREPYLKFGSYKWSWKSQHTYETINPARRQSYLDSVRVAKGADRYNDVAP